MTTSDVVVIDMSIIATVLVMIDMLTPHPRPTTPSRSKILIDDLKFPN